MQLSLQSYISLSDWLWRDDASSIQMSSISYSFFQHRTTCLSLEEHDCCTWYPRVVLLLQVEKDVCLQDTRICHIVLDKHESHRNLIFIINYLQIFLCNLSFRASICKKGSVSSCFISFFIHKKKLFLYLDGLIACIINLLCAFYSGWSCAFSIFHIHHIFLNDCNVSICYNCPTYNQNYPWLILTI